MVKGTASSVISGVLLCTCLAEAEWMQPQISNNVHYVLDIASPAGGQLNDTHTQQITSVSLNHPNADMRQQLIDQAYSWQQTFSARDASAMTVLALASWPNAC